MSDDPDDISVALGRLAQSTERFGDRERALPCHGISDDRAASEACDKAAAFEDCHLLPNVGACARSRMLAQHDRWKRHLDRARAPQRSVDVLLASVQPAGAMRLERREPLKVVWRWMKRDRADFGAAGKLRGGERLLLLAGPRRLGKSTAACVPLAERGGAYVLAHDFRPGFDVDRAVAARVLVIDQWGREEHGQSDWSLQLIEHVVKTRYEQKRDTIGCGNFAGLRANFEKFYGDIISSVLNEGGAWIDLKGDK